MSEKAQKSAAETSAPTQKDEFEVLMKSSKSPYEDSPRQDVGH
ncbi:hypothetical protein [Tateyamaria sp. SN3-11]